MQPDSKTGKFRPEDYVGLNDNMMDAIGSLYTDFYDFKNQRQGTIRQFQYNDFDTYLKTSRELFWNSAVTQSDDLKELGLDFAFPFIRKEVMDFLGRISSLNIAPVLSGEGLSMHGVRVLQAMYKKWRLKSTDRVEKFWETLYGIVNGTVCIGVSWDGNESVQEFLREYNPTTGDYKIDKVTKKMWNDVRTSVVPLEEIYLSKIWQRNIQLQDSTIRKQEMTMSEFKAEYGNNPMSEFVASGSTIAEDSLYFQLLGGSGVTTTDKIQVLTQYKTIGDDKKLVVANGIPLNALGKGRGMRVAPNPFAHKMQPYVWSMHEPIDEKFAYGLSMPFLIKDGHKLLNTSYTMLVESELRAIDPPYLSSDIEAPDIIFGKKKVIPVMDVNAYKPIDVREGSGAFYTMMNSLQGVMSSHAQGGSQAIAPSRQPKAAREIIAIENMKQQALGNSLVMYFDMVSQELQLVLRTALQFYASGKFADQKENLIRAITLPDFPLQRGGIGRLELRLVKQPQDALALYFEAANRSIENGKTTEIVEFPAESLDKLIEFSITDIRLEPEKSDALEKAAWNEGVMQHLIKVFIPMGLADPAKVFLRFLEKNGEHPSDFASEKALPQLMSSWGAGYKLPPDYMAQMGREGVGATPGNMLQSTTGTQFGSQSNGGFGQEMA